MAIDDREDGLWAVTTDRKGNVVQENLYTGFKIVTEPGAENLIKDEGARTAAQIQNALNPASRPAKKL